MATVWDDVAGSIEGFIRREFRVAEDDPSFSRDIHLYESGYVDSTGVVELIAFVESTFGVQLGDEHIFSERFTTVNGISGVIGEALPTVKTAVRFGGKGSAA